MYFKATPETHRFLVSHNGKVKRDQIRDQEENYGAALVWSIFRNNIQTLEGVQETICKYRHDGIVPISEPLGR